MHGAGALSDAELVAIQLGSGGRGESAIALAQALLAEWGGVTGLARAAVDELARRRGVGPSKAARLVAAFALAGRVAGRREGRVLRTTADIAAGAAVLPRSGRGRKPALNGNHSSIIRVVDQTINCAEYSNP